MDHIQEPATGEVPKNVNKKRKAAARKRKSAVSRTSTAEKRRERTQHASASGAKKPSGAKRTRPSRLPEGYIPQDAAYAYNAGPAAYPDGSQAAVARQRSAQQKAALKKAPARKKKKKYKINKRRLATFLLCLFLVFLLLFLLVRGISRIGQKKGWSYIYVKPTSSDCRIGVVTRLDENGAPKTIDLAEEVKDGVYAIPVQRGGTTAVIVSDDEYSFNRVNASDPDYYLAEVTSMAADTAERQKSFVEKYQPSVVSTGAKKIASSTTKKLPKISFYSTSRARNALATLGVGSKQLNVSYKDMDYQSRKHPAVPEKSSETTTFTFTASGDNLIHQKIYEQASVRAMGKGYDFDACYEEVSDFYLQHDLSWLDMESLVSNSIEPSTYPSFSSPGEVAKSVYDMMKVRVFNVSNNHIYDKSTEGIESTMEFYAKDMPSDILVSGLYNKKDLYNIPIYTCKGRAVAVLAYTDSTNGINTPEDSKYRVVYTDETDIIKKQVKKAREVADVVIVSCHWGTEDSHVVNDNQKDLAQSLADWGADLIIGTHPHVVQDAEWLTAKDGRKVFCAYSLGNFISTQSQPDELIGLVLECTISTVIDAKGNVSVEVEKPLLYPVITVYGTEASNVHVVWFSDFDEEMASAHGVTETYPTFTYNYITYILKKYVNEDFLVLPVGMMDDEEDLDDLTEDDAQASSDDGSGSSAVSASSTSTTTFARSTTTAAATTAAPSTTASTSAATTASEEDPDDDLPAEN